MKLDTKLFHYLFNLGQKNKSLGNFMLFIAKDSSNIFFVIYALMILFIIITEDNKIFPFLLGPALALFIVKTIRRLNKRQRPFIYLNIDNPLKHSKNSSFPSQHAVSAFAIGTAIYNCFAPLGILTLVFASLTAFSRIIVGVHYPSDILVGAFIGICLVNTIFVIL